MAQFVAWFKGFSAMAESGVMRAVEIGTQGVSQFQTNPLIAAAAGAFAGTVARKLGQDASWRSSGRTPLPGPEDGALKRHALRRMTGRQGRLGRHGQRDHRRVPARSPVLRQNPSAGEVVDLSVRSGHHLSSMITLVLHLLRLLPVLFGGHRQLALENLALRQQLAVYKRMMTRPRLRRTDRLFWVGLARIWAGWRQSLVIVTPDTVLRWQRRRFREYWTRLSAAPPEVVRPSTPRSGR